MSFPEYLERKYLEWQNSLGKRKTVEEFAAWLGVSRPLMTMWLNGKRRPGTENLKLLSAVFGNEVYDILGIERPNPYLQKINQLFERISPEHQQKLAEDAERYETNNLSKTSKRRKPKSNP